MLIIFTCFAVVDILVYLIDNNLCRDNAYFIPDMLFSNGNQLIATASWAMTVLFWNIQNNNVALCLGKIQLLLGALLLALMCLNSCSFLG